MKYQDQLQHLLFHLIQRKQQVTTIATFQINNSKLYVAVVILPLRDKIKFLENIKQGITEKFFQDKSEITTQQKNNKFDYMIDSTFLNISKL